MKNHDPLGKVEMIRKSLLVTCTVLVGCGVGSAQPVAVRAQDSTAVDLPPAGFGTLGQDDIGVSLVTPAFAINVFPLDERIIRLLAPDTYGSMHRLLESRRSDISEAARRHGIQAPSVLLVSFFGREPRARFDPEGLTITGQNRLFRPQAVIPLSPSFTERQLNQRETARAIYVYEDGLRLLDPFSVSYNGVSTNEWERILRVIDRERAAVSARAAAARKPPDRL